MTDRVRIKPASGGSKRKRTVTRVAKPAAASNVRDGYAEAVAPPGRADATAVYEVPREGWRLDAATGRVGSSQWFG